MNDTVLTDLCSCINNIGICNNVVFDIYLWTPIFRTQLGITKYAKAPYIYGAASYTKIHTTANWLHSKYGIRLYFAQQWII